MCTTVSSVIASVDPIDVYLQLVDQSRIPMQFAGFGTLPQNSCKEILSLCTIDVVSASAIVFSLEMQTDDLSELELLQIQDVTRLA